MNGYEATRDFRKGKKEHEKENISQRFYFHQKQPKPTMITEKRN